MSVFEIIFCLRIKMFQTIRLSLEWFVPAAGSPEHNNTAHSSNCICFIETFFSIKKLIVRVLRLQNNLFTEVSGERLVAAVSL